jgi:K+-transporting ATPase ATPase C chain
MRSLVRAAVVALVIFTVVTGVISPLAVTVVAQAVFPFQSRGSVLTEGGTDAGSALIGQSFSGPEYFWGRPSATPSYPYNAASSSGRNYGPSNPDLARAVEGRVNSLRSADPEATGPVPVDLVTASASGLDPHISPAAALYQVDRVAKARGLERAVVVALVTKYTEGRLWGLIGEPRVNVLRLNLALDKVE